MSSEPGRVKEGRCVLEAGMNLGVAGGSFVVVVTAEGVRTQVNELVCESNDSRKDQVTVVRKYFLHSLWREAVIEMRASKNSDTNTRRIIEDIS